MHLFCKWAASFLLFSTLPVVNCAQVNQVPTLEQNISLKLASSPRISPDARYIAYEIRETDWKENKFARQLWLVEVATGKNFQLTRGKHDSGNAEWSPDGRWLAFVTERELNAVEPRAETEKKEEPKDSKKEETAGEGKPADQQIWIISPEGGEAWQLTKAETDVGGFHWSKDGNSILFTANFPEAKTAKDRKEKYSEYDVIEKDYNQNQLWLVDVRAAAKNDLPVAARQITSDRTLNVNAFAWSPDSTRVAFSATHSPLLAYGVDEDIYLLDLAHGNTVSKIVALPGPDTSPMFSPDGKQLAFYTSLAQPFYYYANGHIAAVDLATVLSKPATTPGDVRDLTPKFDEDVQAVEWTPQGIYFGAAQKTAAHLFLLNPVTLKIDRITSPEELLLEDVSLTPDGKSLAYFAEDSSHMAELFTSACVPFAPRKLTDMTAQVKYWKLGTTEVISWKSKDGASIEGILHKPADYDPSRKYPLLVVIHGGPTGTSQPTLSPEEYAYPVQIFLSKGALVLEPNYRGSAGYGAEFRALNVRNLGVGDMWDVMSGVDSLIAKGIVDPNRMGSMGWSEGGYISAFLTTHTDRFKAISVGAGISDWMTYYANTDITPFTPQYLHATPWEDPEVYAKTSPITTIKQAKTPTLIQQGSNDKRVPVPNSFELYHGLMDQHVPVRMILYTGFGHGINKPKSLLALQHANLDWFSHYIWNEPIPKDSPLYGTSELEVAK